MRDIAREMLTDLPEAVIDAAAVGLFVGMVWVWAALLTGAA